MTDRSVLFYDPDLAKFGNAISPFVRLPSYESAQRAERTRFEDRYGSWFDQPTATDWLEMSLGEPQAPPSYFVGGPGASYAVGAEAMTPLLFAQRLLLRLGMPMTDNNIRAMVAFQNQEGGHMANKAWFNPLNVMQPFEGAVQAAGNILKGIKAYRSWDDGVVATANLLRNGKYPGILAALARSAPPEETIHEIALSPFGWYKMVGGVRVPLPHDAANIILRSDAAFRAFALKAYPDVSALERMGKTLLTVGAVVGAAAGVTLLAVLLARRARSGKSAPRQLPRLPRPRKVFPRVLPGT